MAEKHWEQSAVKRPGAFTAKAKAAGMSVHSFAIAHQHSSGLLGQQARLALVFERQANK